MINFFNFINSIKSSLNNNLLPSRLITAPQLSRLSLGLGWHFDLLGWTLTWTSSLTLGLLREKEKVRDRKYVREIKCEREFILFGMIYMTIKKRKWMIQVNDNNCQQTINILVLVWIILKLDFWSFVALIYKI